MLVLSSGASAKTHRENSFENIYEHFFIIIIIIKRAYRLPPAYKMFYFTAPKHKTGKKK